jgi:hypothetical protein
MIGCDEFSLHMLSTKHYVLLPATLQPGEICVKVFDARNCLDHQQKINKLLSYLQVHKCAEHV